MNKEELNKVFDWLEENMNRQGFYYFKMQDGNQITAYWKIDNRPFAQFYVKPILKLIKDIENENN